jgi:hypothetical protein
MTSLQESGKGIDGCSYDGQISKSGLKLLAMDGMIYEAMKPLLEIRN